jgi:hypothetical protein
MKPELISRSTLIAFAFGRLSREDSLSVLAETERNDVLSRELEDVLLVMRAYQEGADGRQDAYQPQSAKEPVLTYLLRVAAVLVAGLMIVASASELTKGKYHDLARVADVEFLGRYRGDGDDEIELARKSYIEGDRHEAIGKLERELRTRPPGESMAVARCMLGAMLLSMAERSKWGLFPRYDEELARQALYHLALARQSTNVRVVEEAHLLRMKGLLMLNRPQDAITEGEEVVREGGEGGVEVRKLLREIKDR